MSVPNQFDQKGYEAGRKTAMGLGSAVYIGVILVATTLNISFILLALPGTSYFVRFLLVIGGVLVGMSMLAFPVAIHNWAVSGWHRWVALFLYYGEMAIVGINTIVAFSALMYKFGGMAVPDWVGWYEPYSIGAIIYTLIAWGTLWVTDPRARQKAKMLNAFEKFNNDVAESLTSYTQSYEGKEAIKERANSYIEAHFRTMADQGPLHWNQPMQTPGPMGGGAQAPSAPQAPQLPAAPQSGVLWNLPAWLNYIRMDGASAYSFLASYGLNDGNSGNAYTALQSAGYIPTDLPFMVWSGNIYGELLRNYGPQSAPGFPIAPPQFNPNASQNPPKGSVR